MIVSKVVYFTYLQDLQPTRGYYPFTNYQQDIPVRISWRLSASSFFFP